MQQDPKVTVETLQLTQALKYIFVATAFYAAVFSRPGSTFCCCTLTQNSQSNATCPCLFPLK